MSEARLFHLVPGTATDVEPNATWGKARARRDDPETSHAAAASVADLTGKQRAVLSCLRAADRPLTDQELALLYVGLAADEGWPDQSDSGLRTRRSELVERGLVASVGKRRLDTGRLARTWAPAGSIIPGGAA
jgi:hypothetical protein